MPLWSLVLPFPPFTSHTSVPSSGISEMLTADLPPQGTDPFSFFIIHSSSKETTGAAQLSCARIGIFGHLPPKTAAFPACSCPCAGSKPAFPCPQHPWHARYMHYLFPVMLSCCTTFLPIPLCGSSATSASQGWKQISSLLISAVFLLPRGSRAAAMPAGHVRGEFVLSTC